MRIMSYRMMKLERIWPSYPRLTAPTVNNLLHIELLLREVQHDPVNASRRVVKKLGIRAKKIFAKSLVNI